MSKQLAVALLTSGLLATGCASCGEEENNGSNSTNIQVEPDMGGQDGGDDAGEADAAPPDGGPDADEADMAPEVDPPVLIAQPSELLLRPGEMQPLTLHIEFDGEEFTAEDVTWTSDDETIATVDAEGRVTAADVEGSTSISADTSFEMTDISATVPVAVTSPYTELAAGRAHTCSISSRGSVYCWGDNGSKQLGLDGDEPHPFAARIEVNAVAFAIGAGTDHTCIAAMSGSVYCWGANGKGQLGTAASDPSSTPVMALAADVVEVTGGLDFTCARDFVPPVPTGDGGTIYCWGSNEKGQLGSDTGGSPSDTPIEVDLPGAVFTDLAAGDVHACGVTTDGETYCWGSNEEGQLGSTPMSSSDTPVLVSDTYRRVWAGGTRSCGRTGDGTIECWGSAESGLGDAAGTTSSSSPIAVEAPAGVTLSELAVGRDHACASATQGGTYCWGANDVGQLGDSTTEPHNAPAEVVNNPSYTTLGAGGDHTCAISQMGDAFCWGDNESGQVGDGTDVYKRRPTAVRPPR